MFLKHLTVIFISCIVFIQCIPPELAISLDLVKSSNLHGIKLSIGTPPQSFQCYLSTVLPKLYLPQYIPSGSSFITTKIYNPNSSTTFVPLNNAQVNIIQDVSSSTFGYTASDTLSILDNQLHIDNFTFITLVRTLGKLFLQSGFFFVERNLGSVENFFFLRDFFNLPFD